MGMAHEQDISHILTNSALPRSLTFGGASFLETIMSLLPQQKNNLQRDIRQLDIAIRKATKRNNTVKADDLTWKRGYMVEMLADVCDSMERY